MGKFETGNDPADHTNREVVDFLTGDEATPDEYERVLAAERGNRARVGILNLTGTEDSAPVAPAEGDPAGPNEAATGQESPADEAKTVDDPQASGDEAVTADLYPDDAPAALGPEKPQSKAEADAHAATLAAQVAAEDESYVEPLDEDRPATQTADQALARAIELTKGYRRPVDENTE